MLFNHNAMGQQKFEFALEFAFLFFYHFLSLTEISRIPLLSAKFRLEKFKKKSITIFSKIPKGIVGIQMPVAKADAARTPKY